MDKTRAISLVAGGSATTEELQEERVRNQVEQERMEGLLDVREHQDVMDMRKNWSFWILLCIVVIVAFDLLLIILIGSGVLKFDQQWIVPTFIADSLVKVIGLAVIICHFLFGGFKTRG